MFSFHKQREPPRGRILSTLKVEREPNDDKLFLFDSPNGIKKSVAIVSPIRQHIRRIDEKLKIRNGQTSTKKSKSQMSIGNNNQNVKRYERMKFMGIPILPTSPAQMKLLPDGLKAIVGKISQTSILSQALPSNDSADKSTSQHKHTNARTSPEDVKLIPKIPECDYTIKEERERFCAYKFAPFSKAQPRGTNAKNLRVDKSLPWMEDELNATKLKLKREHRDGKTSAGGIRDTKSDVQWERKNAENPSAIKTAYLNFIACKLQDLKAPDEDSDGMANKANIDDEIQSTVESSPSLSSDGTLFTNDSGSYVMAMDRKIPKGEINSQKKFQVKVLGKPHAPANV